MAKMKPPRETLDSLLPLLRSEKREIHVNATIVEVAEMSQLIELAGDAKRLFPLLLGRIQLESRLRIIPYKEGRSPR